MKKYTPIGYSDFKKIREENRYYVDKTAMVRPVVTGAEILLLCRPRRFGKTLNLSMLRYFFDRTGDYAHLFEGMAVQQDAEMMQHFGQYPVVTLSFKDARGGSYADAFTDLCRLLYHEWQRHDYLADNPEYGKDLALMEASLSAGTPRPDVFVQAIRRLCDLLSARWTAPVVVLIDEYDTPVQNAWLQDYYEEMVGFLRKLLGLALKDNPNLKKGVLTGILRVSRDSMFSDLNNFKASSGVIADPFADKFGFTEAEVVTMLRHYDLNGREMDDIRSWYDGYRFGGVPIYNPWSIINYVDSEDRVMRPYWVNTSGNELLKRLFFNTKTDLRPHMEALIRGEAVTVRLSEHLVFADLDRDETAVLNLLYFAGYLRAGVPRQEGRVFTYDLSIPNYEIAEAYLDTVSSWLRNDLQGDLREPLLGALLEGDVLTFEEQLSDFALRVFSFYDADRTRSEHFYHAFLLGLLVRLDTRYVIRSNMESGHGRYDICLIPRDPSRKGVVIEIKSPNLRRGETLEQALTAAVAQMAQQKYDTELSAHGVRDVLRLAVAVSGKDVRVEAVEM